MSTNVCGPRVAPDPVQPNKTDKPETPGMVAQWERNKARYARQGLCQYCAAQAAHGHALGFARIESPRSACAMVVIGFPVPKVNGWRALSN